MTYFYRFFRTIDGVLVVVVMVTVANNIVHIMVVIILGSVMMLVVVMIAEVVNNIMHIKVINHFLGYGNYDGGLRLSLALDTCCHVHRGSYSTWSW